MLGVAWYAQRDENVSVSAERLAVPSTARLLFRRAPHTQSADYQKALTGFTL
jgi:hypothetical protein